MVASNFVRWGGLAAIVGGATYASLALLGPLYVYLYSPRSPEDIPPVLNYIPTIFLLFMLVGAMAAIAGLHILQRERYGLLGMSASLVAFVGVAVILVGGLADLLVGQRYPAVADILIVGALMATVGIVALGTVTIVVKVLPRWCGISLILGSPPFAIFFGSSIGVAWALVGYALLRQARTLLEGNTRTFQ